MAKTWVLDTETKGTGAHIAPLKRAASKAAREAELALVRLQRPPREQHTTEPVEEPLRFKIVDLVSGRTLAQEVDVRGAIGTLEGVRSIVDVKVYVWVPEPGRWRLLTLDERRTLWGFRGRSG